MPDHGQRVVRAAPDLGTSGRWYVCPRPNPAANIRLFFFPHAGGGPSTFAAWPDKLPGNVEARCAHYPGRGSRYKEPSIGQLDVLIGSLAQSIQPLMDKPFAFFGHSMGALVAFELARQLRRMNLPQPRLLFVSACGAPHIPDPNPRIHTLKDPEFLQSLEEFNGTPAEVSQYPGMMQLLTPMIRADVEAYENYSFNTGEPPLDCPILALGGTGDSRVSRDRLEGWALQTNSRFEVTYFPGDHFFVNTERDAVLQAISRGITSFSAAEHPSI